MDLMTIVFGVGVGVLVGVSGMGGGTLMTPLLIVVLGVKQVTDVGTDIAYGAVSRTVGARKHLKQGHVVVPLSTSIAIGSVPAALIGVALILVFRLVPRRVVGTGVFHDSILLWAAMIGHVIAGNVDFGLAGTLLIGSIPGVWVGSALSARVPQDSLRLVLSVVLLGSGLGLLTKAGASIPAPVIAAVPVFVALVIVRALASRRRRAADEQR